MCKVSVSSEVPSWKYRKTSTNIFSESVRPNTADIDNRTCNFKMNTACVNNSLNSMVHRECSPTNCPCQANFYNPKIQRHEVARVLTNS